MKDNQTSSPGLVSSSDTVASGRTTMPVVQYMMIVLLLLLLVLAVTPFLLRRAALSSPARAVPRPPILRHHGHQSMSRRMKAGLFFALFRWLLNCSALDVWQSPPGPLTFFSVCIAIHKPTTSVAYFNSSVQLERWPFERPGNHKGSVGRGY